MSNKSPATPIQKALAEQTFSRNADIHQIIQDWPRLQHIIYINNQSLSSMFKKANLDLENIDPNDEKTIEAFKDILSVLVPKGVDKKDDVYNNLSQILHQGGLPFQLESKVVETINQNGYMLDSAKKGMTRRVDLTSTNSGFNVRELFTYTGNVSQNDPDNPEFVQKSGEKPILSGKCDYQVSVSNDQVSSKYTGMLLSTPIEKFEHLLSGKQEKNLKYTQTLKAQLTSLKKEDKKPNQPEEHQTSSIKIK